MAEVLVLGAGHVAGPLIRYLLQHADVTVATRTVSKAEKHINGHPRGKAVPFTADQTDRLKQLIQNADIVVSLLPWTLHMPVANACLEAGKHLVTTSYVRDQMRALDEQVRRKGLLFLNECGLDPGIDHMSAMRVIHKIKSEGGRVEEFHSYCGGLPAPEAANTPLKYKVSWSPRGVLLACKRDARFLKDGQIHEIPGQKLYQTWDEVDIPPIGRLEAYPNGDSIPYREIYGLQDVRTLIRGTYRYPGWCRTWWHIKRLGWLDETPLEAETYAEATLKLAGAEAQENPAIAAACKLNLPEDDETIKKMEWLGLFQQEPLPKNARTPLDALVPLFEQKLAYKPGERDMIIMRHLFIWRDRNGTQHQTTSTFIGYGDEKETVMARTVGLPAAMATHAILEGRIRETGVRIPTEPEIYEPILNALEPLGIRFTEQTH